MAGRERGYGAGKGREGVQADQELTLSSPEWSTWLEEGRRWWNRQLQCAGPMRESATVAAIRGEPTRLLQRGRRGRSGGASRHVGGAGAARYGETRQRPWRQLGYREKIMGRRGRAVWDEREKKGSFFMAPNVVFRR
jgi:hypothetical protein